MSKRVPHGIDVAGHFVLRAEEAAIPATRQADTSTANTEQPLPSSPDETLDMYFSNESVDPIRPPVRRAKRPLPPVLAEHCTACFEEAIFTQGFAFLSENLAAGLDVDAPAYVPSPQHLALAATVAVHPSLSTRSHNIDFHAGSDAALKYLHRLISTVDVKESGLREALRFRHSQNTKRPDRSKRTRTVKSDPTGASDDENEEGALTIRSDYVDSKSLWTNAEDFWAVVGWAFNCSVRYKHRWERWKGLLEFMLDAIHSDLEKTYASGSNLTETLIAQYLSQLETGRGDKRRIMRAIMADGSETIFGEVWKDETKAPKKVDNDPPASKRRKLDLENGDYGDYLDDSDDSSHGSSRPRRSRSATTLSTRTRRSGQASRAVSRSEREEEDAEDDEVDPTDIDGFGGMDSIRLRQKFIAVLTRFSRIITEMGEADSLFMDTEDLFDLFTEFLRPLALPVFQQFVLPLKPYLTVDLQASLNENLCCPLLGSNTFVDQMTQEQFETQLAPKTAVNSSVIDNAKVSLLLESFLRALWKSRLLVGNSPNLKTQLEKGIQARNQKISSDLKKKKSTVKTGNDEDARKVLNSSAERMRVLLNVIVT